MVKLDFFWRSNKEWYYRDENFIPVLREDAPLVARESYERYHQQLAAIDSRTPRTLTTLKSADGIHLEELVDFGIPYDEFCILRETIDIYDYMEEGRNRLSGDELQKFISEVEKKCHEVPQTLAFLKEALGYNTYVAYSEGHIL